jgi:hypothetical protein
VAASETSVTEQLKLEAGMCNGVIRVIIFTIKLLTCATIKFATTLECTTVSSIQLYVEAILEGISDQFSLWCIGQTRKEGGKDSRGTEADPCKGRIRVEWRTRLREHNEHNT